MAVARMRDQCLVSPGSSYAALSSRVAFFCHVGCIFLTRASKQPSKYLGSSGDSALGPCAMSFELFVGAIFLFLICLTVVGGIPLRYVLREAWRAIVLTSFHPRLPTVPVPSADREVKLTDAPMRGVVLVKQPRAGQTEPPSRAVKSLMKQFPSGEALDHVRQYSPRASGMRHRLHIFSAHSHYENVEYFGGLRCPGSLREGVCSGCFTPRSLRPRVHLPV